MAAARAGLGPMIARSRQWVCRLPEHLRRGIRVGVFMWSVLRRKSDELWIGDSHAVLLNTGDFPIPVLSAVDGGRRYIWHLGPRLLYSIATNGFPPLVCRVARMAGRLRASQQLTCVFVFGEIDTRCHLAPRMRDGLPPNLAADYLDAVLGLARSVGSNRTFVVVPPPPSGLIKDHAQFPIAGTLEERQLAHQWLAEALVAAVGKRADPSCELLDLRQSLADADGLLRPELTYDGCHTNDAGRQAVRRQYEAQFASDAAPAETDRSRWA